MLVGTLELPLCFGGLGWAVMGHGKNGQKMHAFVMPWLPSKLQGSFTTSLVPRIRFYFLPHALVHVPANGGFA